MSNKDYSDINRIAMGHLSHEQLALKLLQQTRSSEELMSVLRAGHDRIQYFMCGKPAKDEVAVGQTEAEQADAGKHTVEFQLQVQLSELQSKLDAANVEISALTSNLGNAENQIKALSTELENCKSELTVAYIAKDTAEAKLKDILENYEVEEDGDDVKEDSDAAETGEVSDAGYYVPTRPELLTIALKHGFRTRTQNGGKEDLNDYVYDTLYESIKYSHSRTPK